MKTTLFFAASALFISSACGQNTQQLPNNYSLTVNLSADDDGETMYITSYDNGNKIDSAIVENGIAQFNGYIDEPIYVRLIMDGRRNGDLILEQVATTYTPAQRDLQSDGALNKQMQTLNEKVIKLSNELRNLPNDNAADSSRQAIYDQYETLMNEALSSNSTNALGYSLLLSKIQGMDLKELDATLAKFPKFKDSQRIASQREKLLVKEETSVGKKYKDFEITNGSKTQRLSDYVGNGHYTLVDFWASWCNPCIRETKVIKELYNKYNGKGLEFLGVAVWDKPEDTAKAIETHQLPWQQIKNAQTIPTDIYGIQGIPCIILIDPDGYIVSRDKQDQELIDDVEAAMNKYQAAKTMEENNK